MSEGYSDNRSDQERKAAYELVQEEQQLKHDAAMAEVEVPVRHMSGDELRRLEIPIEIIRKLGSDDWRLRGSGYREYLQWVED